MPPSSVRSRSRRAPSRPPTTVKSPSSAVAVTAPPAPAQPSTRFPASAPPSAGAAPPGSRSAKATRSASTSTEPAIVEPRDETIRASSPAIAAAGFAAACGRSRFSVWSAVRATSAIEASPGTRVNRETRIPRYPAPITAIG